MMNKAEERVVHIFAQPYNHEDAVIIGNKKGLLDLKNAIEKALETGQGDCILMPADGENFECRVIMNDEDWQQPFWQRMILPYATLTDETPNVFTPEDYVFYQILKNEDIPRAAENIKRNQEFNQQREIALDKMAEEYKKREEQC